MQLWTELFPIMVPVHNRLHISHYNISSPCFQFILLYMFAWVWHIWLACAHTSTHKTYANIYIHTYTYTHIFSMHTFITKPHMSIYNNNCLYAFTLLTLFLYGCIRVIFTLYMYLCLCIYAFMYLCIVKLLQFLCMLVCMCLYVCLYY